MLGRVEGRQGYAPPPLVSSTLHTGELKISPPQPVDNLASNGIDSPPLALTWRRTIHFFVDRLGDEIRAGFVVAPLSRAIGNGVAGAAVQYLDPAVAGRRGRPHVAPARPEPLRGRLGERERRRADF